MLGGIVWRCNMWDGIVELGVRELCVLCGFVWRHNMWGI